MAARRVDRFSLNAIRTHWFDRGGMRQNVGMTALSRETGGIAAPLGLSSEDIRAYPGTRAERHRD
jgi:hypothetical protein